ncbi:MAG: HpaII family restriction endonuclease [Agathobacter sp.]|nr:HpaII family restriction endonuclease [Agathobacter sp.]
MANKGEWGEPYVALRVLGERKLYIADKDGKKNSLEWMDVLELIRHEAVDRVVTYRVNDQEDIVIEVLVNNDFKFNTSAHNFLEMANKLAQEIKDGKGRSFEVSDDVHSFLDKIEMQHIKAKSIDKSDLFLSIKDPRAPIVREHVGFSVKSEFGQNPTLFNTAKASAVVYKVDGMTDELMNQINSLMDTKGNVAVSDRCDKLLERGCKLTFVGFPYAKRAKCEAFRENLDLIDPRLPEVIERMLWYHFFEKFSNNDLADVTENIIAKNPCNLSRPEVKYVYMIKSFLYASYCGMTASTLWDGESQVNGGFIKVSADGEVLAYYALESDAFKSYLYSNCYLEFPSTDEGHGNYAKVYKEGNDYFFRLNFQIRYR